MFDASAGATGGQPHGYAPQTPPPSPKEQIKRGLQLLMAVPVMMVAAVMILIMHILALPIALVLGSCFLKQAIWGEVDDDDTPYTGQP